MGLLLKYTVFSARRASGPHGVDTTHSESGGPWRRPWVPPRPSRPHGRAPQHAARRVAGYMQYAYNLLISPHHVVWRNVRPKESCRACPEPDFGNDGLPHGVGLLLVHSLLRPPCVGTPWCPDNPRTRRSTLEPIAVAPASSASPVFGKHTARHGGRCGTYLAQSKLTDTTAPRRVAESQTQGKLPGLPRAGLWESRTAARRGVITGTQRAPPAVRRHPTVTRRMHVGVKQNICLPAG